MDLELAKHVCKFGVCKVSKSISGFKLAKHAKNSGHCSYLQHAVFCSVFSKKVSCCERGQLDVSSLVLKGIAIPSEFELLLLKTKSLIKNDLATPCFVFLDTVLEK